ncbi:MAG: TIGR03668 family PPOX class F420-dependent oxidoreductase [Thermomicrobiales bacterium]
MPDPDLPGWALDLLRDARIGHLATASAAAEPHVIPICFVLVGDALYIAIDEKPKSGRRLLRLRNIVATGRAALVVDRYDEDWTQLAWVLARGPARIITRSDARHAPALSALRDKYSQYRAMALEEAEMIELRPERWSVWRADDSNA